MKVFGHSHEHFVFHELLICIRHKTTFERWGQCLFKDQFCAEKTWSLVYESWQQESTRYVQSFYLMCCLWNWDTENRMNCCQNHPARDMRCRERKLKTINFNIHFPFLIDSAFRFHFSTGSLLSSLFYSFFFWKSGYLSQKAWFPNDVSCHNAPWLACNSNRAWEKTNHWRLSSKVSYFA